MAGNQSIDIPDSTRLTIMLFPPYGFAWLWLHKTLDAEHKKFGTIGVGLYCLLWVVLVGFVLYFFTPLGVGEEVWGGGPVEHYNQREMRRNLERKQKIREMERAPGKGSPAAGLNIEGYRVASVGVDAWRVG